MPWYTAVSAGGAMVTAYPTDWPSGPWKSRKEGEEAIQRWAERQGVKSMLGTIRAAHSLRVVGPFPTRAIARDADIYDYIRHLLAPTGEGR